MHILLIHQACAAVDEPGGTRHHELARFLSGLGHRVMVIAISVSYLTGETGRVAGREPSPGNEDENVTILRAYTYQALHKSFVHRVIAFFSFMLSSFFMGLKVKKVDLVWGTSPPIFQGWTAWMLARLKRVPFLFEVRDLWPEFAIAVGVLKNPTLIKMSLWLEKFLYRHAIARGWLAVLFLLARAGAIRLDAGNKDTANLELARAIDYMGYALDRIGITMPWGIMAARDNIRLLAERVIANGFAIKGIRHHGGVIALRESEAGMSIPGNFHMLLCSPNQILYPVF